MELTFKKPTKKQIQSDIYDQEYWFKSIRIPEEGPYKEKGIWCIDLNYYNVAQTHSLSLSNILNHNYVPSLHEHIQYHYTNWCPSFQKWWLTRCSTINTCYCIMMGSIVHVDSKYLQITWNIPIHALSYWSSQFLTYHKSIAHSGGKEIDLNIETYQQFDNDWHFKFIKEQTYYISLSDDYTIVSQSPDSMLISLLKIIKHQKYNIATQALDKHMLKIQNKLKPKKYGTLLQWSSKFSVHIWDDAIVMKLRRFHIKVVRKGYWQTFELHMEDAKCIFPYFQRRILIKEDEEDSFAEESDDDMEVVEHELHCVKLYVPLISFAFNMSTGTFKANGLILKKDANGVIYGAETLNTCLGINEIDLLSQITRTLLVEITSFLQKDDIIRVLSTHFRQILA
eukprot:75353_1